MQGARRPDNQRLLRRGVCADVTGWVTAKDQMECCTKTKQKTKNSKTSPSLFPPPMELHPAILVDDLRQILSATPAAP